MKWKSFAIAVAIAALQLSGCGGGGGSGASAPATAPGVEVASKPPRRHSQASAHSTAPVHPPAPTPKETPKLQAQSEPRAKPKESPGKRSQSSESPEATPASKPHPAIERLIESGDSGGKEHAVGPGGAVLTPHQAEKVLHHFKEAAREDAKDPGDTENGVEKVLGELTGGEG